MDNPNLEEENIIPVPELEGKSFKKFIEDNTNLLTVFGIFNALSLWASSLTDETYKIWLSLAFLLLSFFPFWEVLMSMHEIKPRNLKYHIFEIVMLMAQLGIIMFILATYAPFFVFVFALLIGLGIWVVIGSLLYLIVLLTIKIVDKNYDKHGKLIYFICLMIGVIPTKILVKFLLKCIEENTMIFELLK